MLQRICILALFAPWLSACTQLSVDEDPYFNKELYRARPPRTLAIAPALNSSEAPGAEVQMRNSLYAAFSPFGYRDIELDRVHKFIAKRALEQNVAPNKLGAYYIADPELADAVLFAEVHEVSRFFLLFYSQIRIRLKLALADSQSKEHLYRNEFDVRNRQFSFPTGPLQIFTSVFSSLWHLREKEVAESFDATAREVASRYLETVQSAGAETALVAKAQVKLPRKALREGDRAEIVVKTAPGRKVFFSLGNLVTRAPMEEKAEGEYMAHYEAKKGDNADYIFASFLIASPEEASEFHSFSAEDQAFGIDTTPPPLYAPASWLASKKGIVVKLAPVGGAAPTGGSPIAAYHVFRAAEKGGKLKPLASPAEPECLDPGAQPGTAIEYAVIAEDEAGNRGELGPRVAIEIPAAR